MHYILNPIITGLITMTIAILQAVLIRKVGKMQEEHEEDKKARMLEDEAMREGVKALLGDAIDRMIRYTLKDGSVETLKSNWAKIQQLNNAYKALHGNGAIKAEMETLEEYYQERLLEESKK